MADFERKRGRQIDQAINRTTNLGRKFLKHTKNVRHKVNKALNKSNERIDDYLNENPLSEGLAAGAAPETETQAIGMEQQQLGQDWLDFAKGQWQVSQERQAALDAMVNPFAQQQMDFATAEQQRYRDKFQPLEDRFVDEASTWDNEARQADRAAAAAADVEQQAGIQRDASQRAMAARGVNPASGAYAGVDRALGLGTALGRTDAMNAARKDVRDEAEAKRLAAINMGGNIQSRATAAGQTGIGAIAGANEAWMNTPGIAGQGYSGALAGGTSAAGILGDADRLALTRDITDRAQEMDSEKLLQAGKLDAAQLAYPGYSAAIGAQGQAGNLANAAWNNELEKYNIDTQAKANEMAGWGELAGSAISTIAPLILSDEKEKEDIEPVPEGDALEAIEEMPIGEWQYKQGSAADDGGQRHIGAMAQDVEAQTGIGNGETIPIVDAIGISMKAIQDLAKKVDAIGAVVGIGARNRIKARRPEPQPQQYEEAA